MGKITRGDVGLSINDSTNLHIIWRATGVRTPLWLSDLGIYVHMCTCTSSSGRKSQTSSTMAAYLGTA